MANGNFADKTIMGGKSMRRYFVFVAIVSVLGMSMGSTAEAAKAPKATAHHAAAKGKTCKKEFMYWKGGKCVDSRNAST
jgi:hypothetical protein